MKLEINNLSFSYGNRQILDSISFTANEGDLIAVMGANGVGKSTLFRCILGFAGAYKGEIRCGGEELRKLSQRETAKRIAYIPQTSIPVFNYTVAEMVTMGAASQLGTLEHPGKSQRDRAYQNLLSLGIEHLAERGVESISGGERQLVLLARALTQNAKILIMDEPTANLDYGNQYKVMEKIAGLAESGYTILMSTHDPEQAFLTSNRAIVLENGSITADGIPSSVLTEKIMQRIYGIKVHLDTVTCQNRQMRVCVPISSKIDADTSTDSKS